MTKVKVKRLFDEVNHDLIERETEVELMIIAWIARVNACFVGDPGTAKSMMVERLMEGASLTEKEGFVQLMHKYLPPEEIYGPIKLSMLKQDKYERVFTNMLQECVVGFLDEIWKCSPASLTTLFRMLNEKKFRNGTAGEVSIPLESCFAASNEYPIGEGYEDLGALWDRFAIRKTIRSVGRSSLRDLLFGAQKGYADEVSSLDEMHQWQFECDQKTWTGDAEDGILELLGAVEDAGIRIGNRRQRMGVVIAQASAVYYDHAEVVRADLNVLKHVYWVHPDHESKVAEIVGKLADPATYRIQQILTDAREVVDQIGDFRSPEAYTALRKVKDMLEELDAIPVEPGMGEDRVSTAKEFIRKQLRKLNSSVAKANK